MTWQWGISAGLPEQFEALPETLPRPFSRLEVPGEALDSAAGCDRLHRFSSAGITISGCDFLPPELARLIPEEPRQIQSEFDVQFRARCRRAAGLGITEFSLAFDLSRAAADDEFGRQLTTLLRRCAGVLEEFKLRLLLPCRIPGAPGAAPVVRQLDFVRKLGYSGFGIVVELHPHEPHPAGEPDGALRALAFADDHRRIRFEPENGNQLTTAVLDRCRRSFSPAPATGRTLFLSPGHGAVDDATLIHFSRLAIDRSKE